MPVETNACNASVSSDEPLSEENEEEPNACEASCVDGTELAATRSLASTAARTAAPAPELCPRRPSFATSIFPKKSALLRLRDSRTSHARDASKCFESRSKEKRGRARRSATVGAITTNPCDARWRMVSSYRSTHEFQPTANATAGNGPGFSIAPASASGRYTTAVTQGVTRSAKSKPRGGQ